MAVLQKIGYKQTGYSEPFIVPAGETVAAALLSGQNFGITAINGAVPIEYTEYRNAGMYVRANANSAGTTLTSNDCNFFNSGYGGKWVLTDDDGTTYFTVDGMSYDGAVYGDVVNYPDQDASQKGVYTLTLSAAFTAVAGTAYRVVGRLLDLGDATATTTYAEGERVVLPVSPVGTWLPSAP